MADKDFWALAKSISDSRVVLGPLADPQEETKPAPEERGWARAGADLAITGLTGASGMAGSATELVAPGNAFAERVKGGNKLIRKHLQSDDLQAREDAYEARVAEADSGDFWGQATAAAKGLIADPALAVNKAVESAPSFAFGLVGGKALQAVAAARGASAGAQVTAGLVGAGAANAAMTGGDARGDAYERLVKAHIADGATPEEADSLATRQSIPAGATGAVLGGVLGPMGAEASLLRGGLQIGAGTARNRAARSAGTEFGTELVEEMTPRAVGNVSVGAVDGTTEWQDDLGRTAVETAVSTAPFAAIGARSEYNSVRREQQARDARVKVEKDLLHPERTQEPARTVPPTPALEYSPVVDGAETIYVPGDGPGGRIGQVDAALAERTPEQQEAANWRGRRNTGGLDTTAVSDVPYRDVVTEQQEAAPQPTLAPAAPVVADPAVERQQRMLETATQSQQQLESLTAEANAIGVVTPKGVETYIELQQMNVEGLIDDDQFASAAGMLAGAGTGVGIVRKQMAAVRAEQKRQQRQAEAAARRAEQQAQREAQEAARDIEVATTTPVPSAARVDPANRLEPVSPAPAEAPAAPVAPRQGRRHVDVDVGGVLGPIIQRMEQDIGREITDIERLYMRLRLNVDPETGNIVGKPRTLKQVAAAAAALGSGKNKGESNQVTVSAVSRALKGIGLDAARVNNIVNATTAEAINPDLQAGMQQMAAEEDGEGASTGISIRDDSPNADVIIPQSKANRRIESEASDFLEAAGYDTAGDAPDSKDTVDVSDITDAPDPALVERNRQIMERNAAEDARTGRTQGLDPDLELLHEELGNRGEIIAFIDDARTEWAYDLEEGDPAFGDLDVEAQAEWVTMIYRASTYNPGDIGYASVQDITRKQSELADGYREKNRRRDREAAQADRQTQRPVDSGQARPEFAVAGPRYDPERDSGPPGVRDAGTGQDNTGTSAPESTQSAEQVAARNEANAVALAASKIAKAAADKRKARAAAAAKAAAEDVTPKATRPPLATEPAPAPAPAPVESAETPTPPSGLDRSEYPSWVADHEADLNGVAVFSDGVVALIQGQGAISGDPVYAAVKGDTRTSVDVTAFRDTRGLFTADELRALLDARARAVTEQDAAATANPDGPFTGVSGTVAASSSIPQTATDYLQGLLDQLGITTRVYLFTPKDLRSGTERQTTLVGPYASALSAGASRNEKGSTRMFGPNGNDAYISVSDGLTDEMLVEVISHEVGHIIEKTALKNADASTRNALHTEHRNWLEANSKGDMASLVRALRNRASAEDAIAANGEERLQSMPAARADNYWRSFSEWFADNVSRWATTNEKPMSLVDKFFAEVGAKIRKLAAAATGRKYVPNAKVAEFLDKMGPASKLDDEAKRIKFSSQPKHVGRTTVEAIREAIGTKGNPRRLMVVQSVKDLPREVQEVLAVEAPEGRAVQGFVFDGKAYLIADGIAAGRERAVFLHEVGSHLGLDNILGDDIDVLAGTVAAWAQRNDGSLEAKVGKAAMRRVANARTDESQQMSELVAYAIEEAVAAGVEPKPGKRTGLAGFLDSVMRAFDKALAAFTGSGPRMTAQDLVTMANAAANVALDDRADSLIDGDVQFSVADATATKFKEAVATVRNLSPSSYKTATQAVQDTLATIRDKVVTTAAFTEDLVRAAAKHLPSAPKYMRLLRQAQARRLVSVKNIDDILSRYDRLPHNERGMGARSVNALIKESTTDKKWAFQPDWLKNDDGSTATVEVDADLASWFKGLSADAQNVIRDVFRHGHQSLVDMKAAVDSSVGSEFDTLIAAAEAKGDTKTADAERAAKRKALAQFESLNAINNNWPYAPLKRFGNFVVVGKSARYMAAEDAGDVSALMELRKDANHYYVAFAETAREARKMSDSIADKYDSPNWFEKDSDAARTLFGGGDSLGAFRRLRDNLRDSADGDLDSKATRALETMMRDVYLTMLGEQSARQAERSRQNIAGSSDDMMRAFATQGRATAHFTSSLENAQEIQDALSDIRKEADSNAPGRNKRREFYNEIIRRHAMNLDYQPTPYIDRAMSATSTWMLLTNPSYHLTNAIQPWVMSLPQMAARHGYTKSWGALQQAYRDIAPLLKNGDLTESDFAKVPEDVREVVRQLVDGGRIAISLETQIGRWRSEEGSLESYASRITEKLREKTQLLETINRLTTAIAAARLHGTADTTGAVEFASGVLYDTHGEYGGYNAPRFMRSRFGRMATQFRKFQLIQLSLFTRLAHGAFTDKSLTPQEQAVMRRAFKYQLAHMGLLGGAMGLPGMATVGWAVGALFGGKDEPWDTEEQMSKLVPPEFARLLVRGVPAALGVDIGDRVAAGQMLSLFPYADGGLDRKGYESLALASLGPFLGGMAPQMADGLGQLAEGNIWRGSEMMMPSGVRNAMRAYREGTEGATTMRGEMTMSPEDISLFDSFTQAFGMPSTTLTDARKSRSREYEATQFFNGRTADITNRYIKAYNNGDTATMRELRTEWMELQSGKARYDMKPTPLSTLLKSPQVRKNREAKNLAR